MERSVPLLETLFATDMQIVSLNIRCFLSRVISNNASFVPVPFIFEFIVLLISTEECQKHFFSCFSSNKKDH